MDNADPTNHQLQEHLLRLLTWMFKEGVVEVHLVAKELPTTDTSGTAERDHHRFELADDASPDGVGLQDVFVVTDEDGRARQNGPTGVPSDLLRPILRMLEELDVDEVHIERRPEGGEELSAGEERLTLMDFVEDEAPQSWPPVFAVRMKPEARNVQ